MLNGPVAASAEVPAARVWELGGKGCATSPRGPGMADGAVPVATTATGSRAGGGGVFFLWQPERITADTDKMTSMGAHRFTK